MYFTTPKYCLFFGLNNCSYQLRHEKTCLCHMNKGADQHTHLHSLISTFVVHWLDTIIFLISIYEISSLYLASVAEQAGLSLTWSQTPEDRFSRDVALC